MTGMVTISKDKYKELVEKAKILETIVDEEGLTAAELKKLRLAEKSKHLTEKEAKIKYPGFCK